MWKREFGKCASETGEEHIPEQGATHANVPPGDSITADPSHPSAILQIAQNFITLRNAEEELQQSEEDSETLSSDTDSLSRSSISTKIRLEDLFNLDRGSWMDINRRSARASLDEELRVYKLLDLDAPSEDALDFDADEHADLLLED
jgi:hypothetical protein